jgi:hypothetical protein
MMTQAIKRCVVDVFYFVHRMVGFISVDRWLPLHGTPHHHHPEEVVDLSIYILYVRTNSENVRKVKQTKLYKNYNTTFSRIDIKIQYSKQPEQNFTFRRFRNWQGHN